VSPLLTRRIVSMNTTTQTDANAPPPNLAELIPLKDVPGLLPRQAGKKVHVATIYRWCFSGRLQAVKIAGRYYTTREAIAALAEPVQPRRRSGPRVLRGAWLRRGIPRPPRSPGP
jgi:hypothetical protein